MDTMTPDQLFLIIGATACVIIVLCADQWWPFVKAFGSRYFVVRSHYVEDEDANDAPETAFAPVQQVERPNEGATHSNANERPFGGSGTVHERGDELVLDSAQVEILRRITAHKVSNPGAGKAESIYTLFGAKKGSSARYQECSAVWDLLYPPIQPGEQPRKFRRDPDEQQKIGAWREEVGLTK